MQYRRVLVACQRDLGSGAFCGRSLGPGRSAIFRQIERVFPAGAVGADPDGVGAGRGFHLPDIGVVALFCLFTLLEDFERCRKQLADLRGDRQSAKGIWTEVAQFFQEVRRHVFDRAGCVGGVHRGQREKDAVARGFLVAGRKNYGEILFHVHFSDVLIEAF